MELLIFDPIIGLKCILNRHRRYEI